MGVLLYDRHLNSRCYKRRYTILNHDGRLRRRQQRLVGHSGILVVLRPNRQFATTERRDWLGLIIQTAVQSCVNLGLHLPHDSELMSIQKWPRSNTTIPSLDLDLDLENDLSSSDVDKVQNCPFSSPTPPPHLALLMCLLGVQLCGLTEQQHYQLYRKSPIT
jgi:hypothetical protein